jgi:peptidoglycan/xylan/chitin deacetylase (PgdA/CDA1 family)
MSLRTVMGAARRRVLCSLHRRDAACVTPGPVVSFAFDDFPRTAYTVGGAILVSFGVRGTYYVAMGLMNGSNLLGDQFRADDLFAALADGHELANHTFSHISSRRVPLHPFLEDVRKGQSALAAITGNPISGHFAYPFGEVSFEAKKALGREMASCRGTHGGFNGPVLDLNLLRANPLYGDLDRLDTVRELLTVNEECGGWLIFYTHDVRPDPSPYGCTPQLLVETVRLAVQRSHKVLPVAQVLEGCTTPSRNVPEVSCLAQGG